MKLPHDSPNRSRITHRTAFKIFRGPFSRHNPTYFLRYSNFEGLNSGFINVITGAPVTTQYGNQVLNTSEANLGFIGITVGTDYFALANVTNNDNQI